MLDDFSSGNGELFRAMYRSQKHLHCLLNWSEKVILKIVYTVFFDNFLLFL